MKQAVLPVALAAALSLAGCSSKELSRSKAARLIKEDKAIQTNRKYINLEKTHPIFFNSASELKDIKLLEKVGWITLTMRECKLATCADSTLTGTGRERSKNWRPRGEDWQIPTMKREFVEVTGIEQVLPTIAVVHYSWRWIPTDDGKLLGLQPSAPETGERTLNLFDDGWRATE